VEQNYQRAVSKQEKLVRHISRLEASFCKPEVFDIEDFREKHVWDTLETRYYTELSFIKFDEKPLAIRKKKVISPQDAEIRNYYSKCYFDDKGLPLRIDEIGAGTLPSETYLLWENDKLLAVYEFRLGFFFKTRLKDRPHLSSLWIYEYDGQTRLSATMYVSFEDYTYYRHDKLERHCRYEYDDQGLSKIYSKVIVFPRPLRLPKLIGSEDLYYDREREAALARRTILRFPLIPVPRKPKKIPPFSRGFYGGIVPGKVPICPDCQKPMSFLGHVDMGARPFVNKPLLDNIPIFFCFDCLQWESRSFDYQMIKGFGKANGEIRLFPELGMDFIRCGDEDQIKSALVKVGGLPDWIQSEEWPICPECQNKMLFVCQLNTDEEISNGEACQAFGDSGMLYVFSCCRNVTTVMQCH